MKLSTKDKLKILGISEDFLDNIENYVEEISNLKRTVEFDPIYERIEKENNLKSLKDLIPQNAELFLKIEEEKDNLLQINKNIVDDLNKKIVYLEILMSLKEKEKIVKK